MSKIVTVGPTEQSRRRGAARPSGPDPARHRPVGPRRRPPAGRPAGLAVDPGEHAAERLRDRPAAAGARGSARRRSPASARPTGCRWWRCPASSRSAWARPCWSPTPPARATPRRPAWPPSSRSSSGPIVGLLMTALGVLFAPQLVAAMGAGPEVVAEGAAYLRTFSLGAVFLVTTFVAGGVLRGAGDARTPLLVTARDARPRACCSPTRSPSAGWGCRPGAWPARGWRARRARAGLPGAAGAACARPASAVPLAGRGRVARRRAAAAAGGHRPAVDVRVALPLRGMLLFTVIVFRLGTEVVGGAADRPAGGLPLDDAWLRLRDGGDGAGRAEPGGARPGPRRAGERLRHPRLPSLDGPDGRGLLRRRPLDHARLHRRPGHHRARAGGAAGDRPGAARPGHRDGAGRQPARRGRHALPDGDHRAGDVAGAPAGRLALRHHARASAWPASTSAGCSTPSCSVCSPGCATAPAAGRRGGWPSRSDRAPPVATARTTARSASPTGPSRSSTGRSASSPAEDDGWRGPFIGRATRPRRAAPPSRCRPWSRLSVHSSAIGTG